MVDIDEPFRFQDPTRTYASALECGRVLKPPEVTIVVVVGGDRFGWSKRCHLDLVTFGYTCNVEQHFELTERLNDDIQDEKVLEVPKNVNRFLQWDLQLVPLGCAILL